jgi:hypothetical protein
MSSLCSIELQRKRVLLIDDVRQYVEEDDLWPLLKLDNKLHTHEGKLYVTDMTVRETFPNLPKESVWNAIT